jgi:hypothetical protein
VASQNSIAAAEFFEEPRFLLNWADDSSRPSSMSAGVRRDPKTGTSELNDSSTLRKPILFFLSGVELWACLPF